MKREMIIALVLSLIFITVIPRIGSQVTAPEEAEFGVRFHSFGKNATINLKEFLGESKQYLVSKTENVIVRIDQERGIAYLEARPGWEGTEQVFFKTIESQPIIEIVEEEEEKEEEPMPLVPENFSEEIPYEYEIPLRFFGGTIDASVLELLREIRREEIRKLSKKVEKDRLELSINEEIDFLLEKGTTPKISMNFSLVPQQAGGEIESGEIGKEGSGEGVFKTKTYLIIAIIVNVLLFLIVAIAIYSYIKRQKIKPKKEKKEELEELGKDIKHSVLYELRLLQESLGGDSSRKFLDIVRGFFSREFGASYNFRFEELKDKIKDSDINESMKKETTYFINKLSTQVGKYGVDHIPKKELKRLIIQVKKIIREL